jgi:membrane protein DedA with SNARE-associated domain
MTDLLTWLGGLPTPLLYLAIAAAACVENLFPPLPADTAVALGAFVAAQGSGTAWGTWLATLVGNLLGALFMVYLGRKYGANLLADRLPSLGGANAMARVQREYRRHGLWSIAVSRFVPAVRAIVPPFVGALRVGIGRAVIAMAVASAIWYGLVTWFAFTLGANSEALLEVLRQSQGTSAIIALVVLLLGGGFWWYRRSR